MKSVASNLSGDGLLECLGSVFEKVPDHRPVNRVRIKLSDFFMSGFSVFSLKFPSLLKFEEHVRADTSRLRPLYKIGEVPSDTHLRSVLDEVEPEYLKPPFKKLFMKLRESHHLKQFKFYKDKYLLSIDGTEYFTSDAIHCESCMSKKTNEGGLRYHHQMLGGCLVHPSLRTVVPLCPEPIRKQDGIDKNDCERNALRRFLNQLRRDHPKLPLILTADALHTNGPLVRDLKAYDIDYIMSVKPGSHEKLFEAVRRWENDGAMEYFAYEEEIGEKVKKHRSHQFHFRNRVLLNHADVNLSTNFLEYWETTQWVSPKTKELMEEKKHFSWVTSFEITSENIMQLMRGGRARWKIENETFNTLKNQGYEFEHNFGHGYNHLSTNFAYLMWLAFLFDQIQQIGSKQFQTLLKKCSGRITYVWDVYRAIYRVIYATAVVFYSWAEFLEFGIKSAGPDTS